MKIFYVVKNINKIPSCQYNILMLNKLGYSVVPVFGQSTEAINKKLRDNVIEPIVFNDGNSHDVLFILRFRKYIRRFLKDNCKKEDLVFLGTADTGVCLSGLVKKYNCVLCVKELYDHDKSYYRKLIQHACQESLIVVACEINRARYMKAEWKLQKIPFVVSNRPYYENLPTKCSGTQKETKEVIQKIKDKKAVIYQANHIHYAKELINLAVALRKLDEDFVLVLVGNIDNQNDIAELKKIYPDIICAGYINSPLHMEITSNAYIGITVYQENSLNNLFCAPNKIYEYACCGVPTLANNVPGLIETVAISGSGVCVDWNEVEDIYQGIVTICDNYQEYQEKSLRFYKESDNLKILDLIVNEAKILNKKLKGEK